MASGDNGDYSSDSEASFDGFTHGEIAESVRRCEEVVLQNESDISVSDVSLIEDDSDDEIADVDDPVLAALGADWLLNLRNKNLVDFTEITGVNHGLEPSAKPVDYFKLFLPDNFFEMVARETNLYAQQNIATSPDPRWLPTCPEEMKAFFCISIMMGIKQLPRLSCYWSKDLRFNDPYISSIMSRTRYVKLNQYLHLRDSSQQPARGDPNYDPLYKVRPLIDLISPRLFHSYKPNKNLSVDEGMIGYKGRIFFRQYMPAKPTKWGIKVWQLCESESGYCCGFEVYTGRKVGGRQHGLGYDVVWNLTQPYHNQGRHIYFDRFFSSLLLCEHLLLVDTYSCGTIMQNRKGKLKKQGDVIQMQKGGVLVTSFKDKRQIIFLSTSAKHGVAENGMPHVNLEYNANMGGVDKFDQLLFYYPVGRSGMKWWRYILYYIINILYSKSVKDPSPPNSYDHLAFRADVADQLRAGFTSRAFRVGRKSNNIAINNQNLNLHEPVKIDGRKKICRQCSSQKRKTPKGRPVETSYMCSFCKIPLCRVGCFGDFHDRNIVH